MTKTHHAPHGAGFRHGIPGSNNYGRFQYTGQIWLPEVGVYHYKARAYSPTLGPFLQTDPIWYAGGTNIYAYTGNDPVNRNYAVNGLNQYTAAGPANFCYDPNGNLTADGSSVYRYDVENRLVEKRVQQSGTCPTDSSGYGGTLQASLAYDPLGRLYETSGGTPGITRFLYDGDQLALNYDQLGTIKWRYYFGPGVDEPIIADFGGYLDCGNTRFVHANHQGSIVTGSDCQGNRTTVLTYDEYGIPGGSNWGRFQYTGQAWIPELGMYHYKARIYSPTLGRFMQVDPIGYDDQVNLYAYVGNDPVNKTDPTGLKCDAGGILCTSDVLPSTTKTTVQNTAAMDKAMHDNAGKVRVGRSATSEKIGFLKGDKNGTITFRNPKDAKTGSTGTQDNARASKQPGDVAVMHSHIPGTSVGVQDDTQKGRSLGDSQPLTRGLTNGTVIGSRLGVHEVVAGILQFRMIDGTMTKAEQRDMQRNLDEKQSIFP